MPFLQYFAEGLIGIICPINKHVDRMVLLLQKQSFGFVQRVVFAGSPSNVITICSFFASIYKENVSCLMHRYRYSCICRQSLPLKEPADTNKPWQAVQTTTNCICWITPARSQRLLRAAASHLKHNCISWLVSSGSGSTNCVHRCPGASRCGCWTYETGFWATIAQYAWPLWLCSISTCST